MTLTDRELRIMRMALCFAPEQQMTPVFGTSSWNRIGSPYRHQVQELITKVSNYADYAEYEPFTDRELRIIAAALTFAPEPQMTPVFGTSSWNRIGSPHRAELQTLIAKVSDRVPVAVS